MHRKIEVKNKELFNKIRELSNPSKFRILELIQGEEISITSLAKKVNLAFNKCSNYCTQLEENGLLTKQRQGKKVLVKGNLNMKKLSGCLA
jgi:predicted transcriptional regulator